MNTPKRSIGDQPSDETLRNLEGGIKGLDLARVQSLTAAATVRTAKGGALAREQQRLARKLGADHPRVADIARQRELNDSIVAHVVLARDQAGIVPPEADEKAYVFHGFVRDAKLKGVPNLTVALYNERRQWVGELGYACTDGNGYFLLRVSAGRGNLRGGEKDYVPGAAGLASFSPGDAVFPQVLDAQQATLHASKDPVFPDLGKVDYRVIILAGYKCECAPPPAQKDEPVKAAPSKGSGNPTPAATTPPPASAAPAPVDRDAGKPSQTEVVKREAAGAVLATHLDVPPEAVTGQRPAVVAPPAAAPAATAPPPAKTAETAPPPGKPAVAAPPATSIKTQAAAALSEIQKLKRGRGKK